VNDRSNRAATLQGLAAIVLWSSLAAITANLDTVPPFQLAAISFAIASLVGLIYAQLTHTSLNDWRTIPVSYWLLGVYGLLGYHATYFFALQNAPALQANLLNYLWPLLIVLFASKLPAQLGGARLTLRQLAGAALGLIATSVIVLDGPATPMNSSHWQGYAAAFTAALIWASYSVGSRLYPNVPSSAVTISCIFTAIGASAFHLLLETTSWPTHTTGWIAILAQGLGPVGLAFYLWDAGMKHGNLRLLAIAAYATPVLSTALLALTSTGTIRPTIWLAAGLITLAAALTTQQKSAR
jgi:drug/metabolite transporter (DMT)-like permease